MTKGAKTGILSLVPSLLCFTAVHAFTARYSEGDSIQLQCLNDNGKWEPGLVCGADTAEPLTFQFGQNAFYSCGLAITQEEFLRLERWIVQEDVLQCRIPVSPGSTDYVPLAIPFWGTSDEVHLHVMQKLHFTFYHSSGVLAGATAYPYFQSRLMFVKEGSIVTLNGNVRWKHHPGTDAVSALSDAKGSFVLMLLLVLVLTIVYLRYLRPRLTKALLASKSE